VAKLNEPCSRYIAAPSMKIIIHAVAPTVVSQAAPGSPVGKFWTFGSGQVALAAPVSGSSPFSNFRFGMPETGSTLRETGWKAATRCGAKRRRAEPAGGCTGRPVLHAWQSLAKPVEYAMEGLLSWGRKTLDHRMAIFRQVNKERAAAHGREIASFPLVGGDRQPEADWHGKIKEVPSGMRLEFGGGISDNMRLSFQAARSIG